MTRKRWYCIALFLPIIVPAISLGIDISMNGMLPHHNPPASAFSWINMLLFMGLVFGGIQYIIFAGGVIWWGRHKTADEIRRVIWFLPMLFAPVFIAGFVIINIVMGSADPSMGGVFTLIVFTFISFPTSYFYVALTCILTRLLQKAKLVHD